METKFNSQICTSRVQSERLLALGLKKETADCHWSNVRTIFNREWLLVPITIQAYTETEIPAWSLHRLIEMMPDLIKDNIEGMLYHLSIDGNSVFYETKNNDLCQFFGDSLYICIIDCIEWLIKEGYFNKEYLV